MTKLVDGVKQRLALGCYIDDLFTLYTHDGPSSPYSEFVDALTHRWNGEDKGPVLDLLNVLDIITDESCVVLKQERYIPHLSLHTYLADFFTKPLTPRSFFAMRDIIIHIAP
eukprot:4020175-Pleurochrysis_carterae.AAC.5